MKFGVKTLLAIFSVVAAFFAGWILPPPTNRQATYPVLVANREIGHWARVKPSDFRTILMQSGDIPDYAARDFSQVANGLTGTRIRKNSFIHLDETTSTRILIDEYVPPNKQAVAIKFADGFNPLALALLSKGDSVSLYSRTTDCMAGKCLIPNCSVFIPPKPEYPNKIAVVLLTESEAGIIRDAQNNAVEIVLDLPLASLPDHN